MFKNVKMVAAGVAAAGVMALAGASGASAATVGSFSAPTGTGSMAVSAQATTVVSGFTSRLVVNGAVRLQCVVTSGSGTINTGVYTPTATIGTLLPAFSNCSGPGGIPFTVVCSNPTPLTTNLNITANPVSGVTAGSITNIRCVVTFSAGCSATVAGSVPGNYTNPTASVAGNLRVLAAGQSLTVSGSTCTGTIPNGAAQFGAPVGTGLGIGDLNYEILGAIANQPFIS